MSYYSSFASLVKVARDSLFLLNPKLEPRILTHDGRYALRGPFVVLDAHFKLGRLVAAPHHYSRPSYLRMFYSTSSDLGIFYLASSDL